MKYLGRIYRIPLANVLKRCNLFLVLGILFCSIWKGPFDMHVPILYYSSYVPCISIKTKEYDGTLISSNSI